MSEADKWTWPDMPGIGRLYAGMCDRVPQLPAPGSPERERSDADHAAVCRGLMAQYEGRTK